MMILDSGLLFWATLYSHNATGCVVGYCWEPVWSCLVDFLRRLVLRHQHSASHATPTDIQGHPVRPLNHPPISLSISHSFSQSSN